MTRLIDLIRDKRSVSIIGMCKNAGKTTALNRLIEEHRHMEGVLALTSIGRDGENVDVVTHTRKPGIYIYENTLVATAQGLLRYCDATREILEATGMSTPLGEVVILRALSDGSVQIAGPSMTEQVKRAADMFFTLGADRVIIDGAVSRKSLCAPAVADGTILCAGASYSKSMIATAEDTAFAAELLTLQRTAFDLSSAAQARMTVMTEDGENIRLAQSDSLLELMKKRPSVSGLWIRGALTDSALFSLLRAGVSMDGVEIIVEDASKLLIKREAYRKLCARGGRIRVRESTCLCAVTVNPFSAYGYHYDKDAFMDVMRKSVQVPVINVMEEL